MPSFEGQDVNPFDFEGLEQVRHSDLILGQRRFCHHLGEEVLWNNPADGQMAQRSQQIEIQVVGMAVGQQYKIKPVEGMADVHCRRFRDAPAQG